MKPENVFVESTKIFVSFLIFLASHVICDNIYRFESDFEIFKLYDTEGDFIMRWLIRFVKEEIIVKKLFMLTKRVVSIAETITLFLLHKFKEPYIQSVITNFIATLLAGIVLSHFF